MKLSGAFGAVLPVVLLAASGSLPASAADILILHSYRVGYEWTDELNRGFVDAFAETPGVSLFFHFLDSRRAAYPSNAPAFRDYLARKHHGRTFRLIFAADDEALDFIVRWGDTLFPHTPVVFCGISSKDLVEHLPRHRFTGLIETFNAAGILAIAHSLRPSARHLYFISDGSTFGIAQREFFEKAAAATPNLTFHPLDGRTHTVAQIRDAVGKLPRDALLLLNAFRQDHEGQYVPSSVGDHAFAAVSPVPVFGVAVPRVGNGILMGTRNGGYEHANVAAVIGRRILAGASPGDIPIVDEEPPSVWFDHQELQRWNIPESRLPPGAEIANRPPSVWRDYGRWIAAGISIALFQLLAIAALIVNIMHRRRIQQRLRTALQAARHADSMKNRFIANISHELRTPMNGVLGLLQVLQNSPLNQEQRESATLAADSARSLLTVLNDLLDIAQIQDGSLKIIHAPFSLRKVLDGVCSLLATRARETGVPLSYTVDSSVPQILSGDSDRLRQVIINLASNALKFTPAGEVRILATTAGTHTDGRALIRIEVHDTGIGIAPEVMGQIFEPFVQVDNSSSRRFAGAGLGLAICRQLVTLMGGRIDGQSQPGAGSLFWLELPFAVETESPLGPAPTPAAHVPAFSSRVVLIVEDNAVNRLVARRLLERTGCRVLQAVDGQQCLDTLKNTPVDLILMDVQMPGMSGLDVTRVIRASEPAGSHVPIIALTASSMAGDRLECLSAGMDDYLSKPIQERDLLDAVRRWMPVAPAR
ncbi:MAG: response regulator [Bryobacterales bacterium]|nr:response regulator [Bryobacterales bacterium]